MFESQTSDYPQDHFTRGFLAGRIDFTRRQMNCEEVACQAQRRSRVPLRGVHRSHPAPFEPPASC